MALSREDVSALVLRVEAASQDLAPLVAHHSDSLASCAWHTLSEMPIVTTSLALRTRWTRGARSRDALVRLLDSYPVVGESVVCYETHGIPLFFCGVSVTRFGIDRVLRTALTSAVLRETRDDRAAAPGIDGLVSFLSAMLGAELRADGEEERRVTEAGSIRSFKRGQKLAEAPAGLNGEFVLDVQGFSYLPGRARNTVVYRTSADDFYVADYAGDSAVKTIWFEAEKVGDTGILCRVPGPLTAWPPVMIMLAWAHAAQPRGRKVKVRSVVDFGFFKPALELLNKVEGVLAVGVEEVSMAPTSLPERKDSRDQTPLDKRSAFGAGILQKALHTASPTYFSALALSVLLPATRSIEYWELGLLLDVVGTFRVKKNEKWDNIKIASTYFSAMNFGRGTYGIGGLIHKGCGFLVDAGSGGVLSYPPLGFALVSMPDGLPAHEPEDGPTFSPIAGDEGKVPIVGLFSCLGVLRTPEVVESLAEDLDSRPLAGLSRLSSRARTILRRHFNSSRETLQFPEMMDLGPLPPLPDEGQMARSVLGVLALCGVGIDPGSEHHSFFKAARTLAVKGDWVHRGFTSSTRLGMHHPVKFGGPVGIINYDGVRKWAFRASPSWHADGSHQAFVLSYVDPDGNLVVKPAPEAFSSTPMNLGHDGLRCRVDVSGATAEIRHLATSAPVSVGCGSFFRVNGSLANG